MTTQYKHSYLSDVTDLNELRKSGMVSVEGPDRIFNTMNNWRVMALKR
jgi:hypothetical protein